ncbi:hypothetical protein [uncultured Ramlibacter sp.]|uniref:hypothetical protein n=1 Tax=uncultured Ramlibacter sp. TaxID=260755 RepID=UPI00260671E4|nr:hypothetical protein [uncultured Ramlibacter sp.]
MGRKDNTNHDPEDKRLYARALKRGHSGQGTESIRPYLRAQLRMLDLLRPTFPPAPEEDSADTAPI